MQGTKAYPAPPSLEAGAGSARRRLSGRDEDTPGTLAFATTQHSSLPCSVVTGGADTVGGGIETGHQGLPSPAITWVEGVAGRAGRAAAFGRWRKRPGRTIIWGGRGARVPQRSSEPKQ
jgi:hypothetical protein